MLYSLAGLLASIILEEKVILYLRTYLYNTPFFSTVEERIEEVANMYVGLTCERLWRRLTRHYDG